MSATRGAVTGELCTCGRQASIVITRDDGSQTGACAYAGGAGVDPVLPCPWCGSETAHEAPWGGPGVCPEYRLTVKREVINP